MTYAGRIVHSLAMVHGRRLGAHSQPADCEALEQTLAAFAPRLCLTPCLCVASRRNAMDIFTLSSYKICCVACRRRVLESPDFVYPLAGQPCHKSVPRTCLRLICESQCGVSQARPGFPRLRVHHGRHAVRLRQRPQGL